ncbi:MAG: hypothetical protein V1850_00270, partial [Candidatus Bathyarchaeota archaeon]
IDPTTYAAEHIATFTNKQLPPPLFGYNPDLSVRLSMHRGRLTITGSKLPLASLPAPYVAVGSSTYRPVPVPTDVKITVDPRVSKLEAIPAPFQKSHFRWTGRHLQGSMVPGCTF